MPTTTTTRAAVDLRVASLRPEWLPCRESLRHDLPIATARKYSATHYGERCYVIIRTCSRCGIERHDTLSKRTYALRSRVYKNVPEGYYSSEPGAGRIPHEAIVRRVCELITEVPAAEAA